MDIFGELRAALVAHDDWPSAAKQTRVIDAARRFVGAVDQRSAVIEQMRQHVTPSEQALSELLNIERTSSDG